jgi:hypothetical protein
MLHGSTGFIERRYVTGSIDLAECNRRFLKGAPRQKFATAPSPASTSYSYSEADSALKSVDTIGAARHRGLAYSGARHASLHVRKTRIRNSRSEPVLSAGAMG